MIDYFAGDDDLQSLLSSGTVGHTAVYRPWGLIVAGPLEAEAEGILYADVNLDDALLPKLRHDIGGSYNRFDIMRVLVNRAPHQALRETMGGRQQIPDDQPEYQSFDKTDSEVGSGRTDSFRR